MHLWYLAMLVGSLFAMGLCDFRWKLTFFQHPKRAAAIIGGMLIGFLLWDAAGIATGVFFRGDSPYMTGIELFPEMPLEEPIFLIFLTYLTLNLTGLMRLLVTPWDELNPPATRSDSAQPGRVVQ
ncbi:lycopene cyclase domain-containing protein [Corynebacterium choanae]|uniref:Lycopene cyclase domain-containing protein n=1 Tax=Corynebacterium choanae TaxID=1862358 RepID=A0A3G6J368_9CORY|nr:lycopene cyclase domain-containing protein [Corynebacterium choanae]AZA12457.1 hypothetical protein CCHOA_00120 [Corynebacterium choanae]